MSVATQKPLPAGWCLTRLGDICKAVRGITFPSSESLPNESIGSIACLTTTAVQEEVKWLTAQHVPVCYLRSQQQIIQDGDLLVSTANSKALVGKLAQAHHVPSKFTFGAFVTVLRPGNVDKHFIFYALRTPEARHYFFTRSSETTNISNLRTEDLLAYTIPLPPLPEQQRIAAILKEQMTAVDKARAAAEARLEAVKALPAAFLREVFPRTGAPLPNGWKVARIGDVASLQGGYAFKSAWFVNKGIRLLRNANIFQNFIAWTDVVSLPLQRRSEFSDYELNEGDIVLALDRPVVAAGLKVARISKDDTPALLLQRVARFKVKAGFSADYLYGFLHTEAFKAAITAHDQSLGVPHVSPSQVESVVIPVPSLDDQSHLAARLREQMDAAEQARAAAETELAAINALPAALLRRAFNGEL